MTADIPNAFIQADMPLTGERVILKLTGVMVDLMVEANPDRYASFVVYENGVKTLYLQVLKTLYGMLIAALLWYKRFRGVAQIYLTVSEIVTLLKRVTK